MVIYSLHSGVWVLIMHKTTMNTMVFKSSRSTPVRVRCYITEDSIFSAVIDYSSHNHGEDGINKRMRQPAIYQIY
jgi:hypothetical protein